MTTGPIRLTETHLAQLTRSEPLRAGSLIVTLFGDSVAPRGGVIWLGSLIEVLAPLGISQRLVRTAVYRLVQKDILFSQQVGRRSYYALTDNGRQEFEEATARIYAARPPEWDGNWWLVTLHNLSATAKAAVKKDLGWMGFGQLGPDTLVHPNPNTVQIHEHLKRLQVHEQCFVFDAQVVSPSGPQTNTALARQLWSLEDLQHAYTSFIRRFKPLHDAALDGVQIDDADAFYIRTLMIHEYRKVLLRDPGLPKPLLPARWPGHQAQQLSGALYHHILSASERYVDHHFANQNGPLPPPDNAFFLRFSPQK